MLPGGGGEKFSPVGAVKMPPKTSEIMWNRLSVTSPIHIASIPQHCIQSLNKLGRRKIFAMLVILYKY